MSMVMDVQTGNGTQLFVSLILTGQFGAKLAHYFGHLAPYKWPFIHWPDIQYWAYVRPASCLVHISYIL